MSAYKYDNFKLRSRPTLSLRLFACREWGRFCERLAAKAFIPRAVRSLSVTPLLPFVPYYMRVLVYHFLFWKILKNT